MENSKQWFFNLLRYIRVIKKILDMGLKLHILTDWYFLTEYIILGKQKRSSSHYFKFTVLTPKKTRQNKFFLRLLIMLFIVFINKITKNTKSGWIIQWIVTIDLCHVHKTQSMLPSRIQLYSWNRELPE